LILPRQRKLKPMLQQRLKPHNKQQMLGQTLSLEIPTEALMAVGM
jgi:hypothetical protein